MAGLVAGWHGLIRAVSVLLTGAGAALPFAVILALAGDLAWRGGAGCCGAGRRPPRPGRAVPAAAATE